MGDRSNGHGVFTYAVVRELNGDDPDLLPRSDRHVHFQDLYTRVLDTVPKWTESKQLPAAARPVPKDLPVVEDPEKKGIDRLEELPKSNIVRLRRGSSGKPAPSAIPLNDPPQVTSLDAAQQVLVSYVQGDQVPQTRVAFEQAAVIFRQEWQRAPDRAFSESRMLFCEARALLFRTPGKDLPPADIQRAKDLLLQSIAIDPNRAYAYNALGLAYLETRESDPQSQLNDYQRAIAAFSDAHRFAPYWAYPLHNMALAYEQIGKYEEAIRMYRQAVTVAPWTSYPAYNLGLLFQKLNRIDEAREEFLRAISIALDPQKQNPKAPPRWAHLSDGYNALASLEINRGRWKAAENKYLKIALRLDPANQLARHNLALLDAGPRHQPEEAIQIWRDLLNSGPNVVFELNLARTLDSVGKVKDAVLEYEKVLDDSSDPTGAHKGRLPRADVRHALALIYVRSGDLQKARSILARGLDLDPANSALERDVQEVKRVAAGQRPKTRDYLVATKLSRKSATH
jgi:tetratricopeptide (TPR) repeat protein